MFKPFMTFLKPQILCNSEEIVFYSQANDKIWSMQPLNPIKVPISDIPSRCASNEMNGRGGEAVMSL